LDTLNRGNGYVVFATIRRFLAATKESSRPSLVLASSPVFPALGLADSSLFALAERNVLVVTDDLELYGHLITRKLGAFNFNHLRDFDVG